MRRIAFALALVLTVTGFSSSSYAARELFTNKTVTRVLAVSGGLYINFNGVTASTFAASCGHPPIANHLNVDDSVLMDWTNGIVEETFAMAQSAMLSGQTVSFTIDGCLDYGGGWKFFKLVDFALD